VSTSATLNLGGSLSSAHVLTGTFYHSGGSAFVFAKGAGVSDSTSAVAATPTTFSNIRGAVGGQIQATSNNTRGGREATITISSVWMDPLYQPNWLDFHDRLSALYNVPY
jgi:hypothetical protein